MELLEPNICIVVPLGAKITVPLLCVNVPLFVKSPFRVRLLVFEADSVPAIVVVPPTVIVGSLVFKSKVPAVTFMLLVTVIVPAAGWKVFEALLN